MTQKLQPREEELQATREIQELQFLKQAISPRKLTKDFKALLLKPNSNKSSLKLSLLEDHQRQSKFLQYAKKSTIIPILLFQLFTQNSLLVTFSTRSNSHEKQQQKTKTHPKQKLIYHTPQQLKEQFMKDKKNKQFLAFIQSKIQTQTLSNKRDKQKATKQTVDLYFDKISITIEHKEQESLSSLFDVLSTLFCILSHLLQNTSTKIQTLEITLNPKSSKSIILSEKSFENFSLNLWNFLIEIKNIENIEFKLPQIEELFSHLQFKRQHSQKQQLHEEQQHLFSQIYRLQIKQIIKNHGNQHISLNFLSKFLTNTPKLKVLNYSIHFLDQNINDNQFMTYSNSFDLFKTISEQNSLIENIFFSNIKLTYQQFSDKNHTQQKEFPDDSFNDQVQIIDRNLYWLRRMQQNCPYLVGFSADFEKKTPAEERRLPQNAKNQYVQSLKTTQQIINLFHKRFINTQIYFNCIKIMEGQGFDFQTILGVLDKISPFAPS